MPSTSKIALLAVFVLCVEIVAFCEYMMYVTGDIGALYALIGVPAALTPTVVSYYGKSTKENTRGGIVYETAMRNIESGNSDEAVG